MSSKSIPLPDTDDATRDRIQSYITKALESNDDILFSSKEISKLTKELYTKLAEYPKSFHAKLAVLLLHLDTEWYTGRHAWTFRQRIRDTLTIDPKKLANNSYTFPELYDNDYLTDTEKNAILQRRRDEFNTIHTIIEKGGELSGVMDSHLCFDGGKPVVCEGLPCKFRDIKVPFYEDESMMCIPYTTALDIFISDDPRYPDEDSTPIPDELIDNTRNTFSGELHMREWFVNPPKSRSSRSRIPTSSK